MSPADSGRGPERRRTGRALPGACSGTSCRMRGGFPGGRLAVSLRSGRSRTGKELPAHRFPRLVHSGLQSPSLLSVILMCLARCPAQPVRGPPPRRSCEMSPQGGPEWERDDPPIFKSPAEMKGPASAPFLGKATVVGVGRSVSRVIYVRNQTWSHLWVQVQRRSVSLFLRRLGLFRVWGSRHGGGPSGLSSRRAASGGLTFWWKAHREGRQSPASEHTWWPRPLTPAPVGRGTQSHG